MNKLLYIFLFASLFFVACSSEDVPDNPQNNDKQIELRLDIKNFVGETKTKAGFDATVAEEQIDNLYLFIEKGSTWHKFYISEPTFMGGIWEKANNKILLSLPPADVGTANVYVVANAGSGTLDGITSAALLNAYAIETANPWSENIKAPLIMSGSVSNHNFATTPTLNAVPLTRAVAKVEVVVTLSQQYQSTPSVTNPNDANDVRDQYKYEFKNFDKNTYLFKPTSKPNSLTNKAWTVFDANFDDGLSAYVLDNDGKVTTLKFTTYINERETGAETTINVALPFWDNGAPPPSFEGEELPIKLPVEIKRNHYYKVAVQM